MQSYFPLGCYSDETNLVAFIILNDFMMEMLKFGKWADGGSTIRCMIMHSCGAPLKPVLGAARDTELALQTSSLCCTPSDWVFTLAVKQGNSEQDRGCNWPKRWFLVVFLLNRCWSADTNKNDTEGQLIQYLLNFRKYTINSLSTICCLNQGFSNLGLLKIK